MSVTDRSSCHVHVWRSAQYVCAISASLLQMGVPRARYILRDGVRIMASGVAQGFEGCSAPATRAIQTRGTARDSYHSDAAQTNRVPISGKPKNPCIMHAVTTCLTTCMHGIRSATSPGHALRRGGSYGPRRTHQEGDPGPATASYWSLAIMLQVYTRQLLGCRKTLSGVRSGRCRHAM